MIVVDESCFLYGMIVEQERHIVCSVFVVGSEL